MTGDFVDRLRKRADARAVAAAAPICVRDHDYADRVLSPRIRRLARFVLRWTVLVSSSAYAVVFTVVFVALSSRPVPSDCLPHLIWIVRSSITMPAILWFLGLFAWSARERCGAFGAALGLLMMLAVWQCPVGP